MEIAPQEAKILASFATYPLLTVEEVCKLHYYTSSASYVNKVLKSLVKRKLLVRPQRPYVSMPYFYHLGLRGVKFLSNEGITASFTPYSYPMQREHLQTTTALMMAISQLPLFFPAYYIEELIHDLVLKHTRPGMRPDVFSLISKDAEHASLWWEVEMQKDQKQFREQKIRKLLQFLDVGYEARYGEQKPTILILTPVSQQKADMLERWLEAELRCMDETNKAQLFRVAYVVKENFDPAILFFEAIWRMPFQDDYVRLFKRD